MIRKEFFMYKTAESVSPKHPDKICDQICDAILDEALSQDPYARSAIEVAGGHGEFLISGELSTRARIDYESIARDYIGNSAKLHINITQQSPEIAQGVDIGGAGDQGIMVGYATSETDSLMPLEVELSRSLCRYLYERFPYDGKTQITVKDGVVVVVVASFQHAKSGELRVLINDWLKDQGRSERPIIHTNPAGDWKVGGFASDTGLSGRKLIIDNYGPSIPIGGGAFSGKDASKVDRSGAYIARKIAADYLNKRHATEVYCQLAYAIGIKEPIQAVVAIDGQEESVENYNLTPSGVIDRLNLLRPQYKETAMWGHFGNGFFWDKTYK